MAFIDVDIEDYLDEVDSKHLINELRLRREKGTLIGHAEDVFRTIDEIEKWPEIKTVLDQQKQDWVIENWERIEP